MDTPMLLCRVPPRMKLLLGRGGWRLTLLPCSIVVDVRLSRELPCWFRVGILLIPGCCDMATFTSDVRPPRINIHKRASCRSSVFVVAVTSSAIQGIPEKKTFCMVYDDKLCFTIRHAYEQNKK